MPRKKPAPTPHPLRAYMDAHGISYREAGEQLECDYSNIHHICTRKSRPQSPLANRIVKWSGGEITFEDLYGE